MTKTIPSQDLEKNRAERLKADPTCSRCGITKTVADFPKRGVDYWCSECRKEYARALYHKKRARMSKREVQALKDTINRRQNKRRAAKLKAMSPSELEAYRERVNLDNKQRRDAVRDKVYRAYGGYVCNCCGETEPMFLSIDHINNDGAEHKRSQKLHTGEQLYRWLIRNEYPDGFQVLCMNCQWGKRNNNGVCPHSR